MKKILLAILAISIQAQAIQINVSTPGHAGLNNETTTTEFNNLDGAAFDGSTIPIDFIFDTPFVAGSTHVFFNEVSFLVSLSLGDFRWSDLLDGSASLIDSTGHTFATLDGIGGGMLFDKDGASAYTIFAADAEETPICGVHYDLNLPNHDGVKILGGQFIAVDALTVFPAPDSGGSFVIGLAALAVFSVRISGRTSKLSEPCPPKRSPDPSF